MTTTTPKEITVTRKTLERIFTEWDRRFREDPDAFESEAKRLLTGTPKTYGEAAAPYFLTIAASI